MNLLDKVIRLFTGQIPAARQQFQHGVMLWYAHDGGTIFAIADDGWWDEYPDKWIGSTESPDEPPAGMVKPIRGFGHVWHINSLEWRFGWATQAEQPGQGTCTQTAPDRWELQFGNDFFAQLEPPPPPPPHPDPPTPDPPSPSPQPPSLTNWVWLPTLDFPVNLAVIAYVDRYGRCQFGQYDMMIALPDADTEFIREELRQRCKPSSR